MKTKRVSAKRKSARPDTGLAICRNALAAFECSVAPFEEGMKQLKAAQKDFEACAKNRNLYSHALRALRHIAKRPCEMVSAYGDAKCEAAIEAGIKKAEDRCWPCFARDALRRGGDQ